MEIGQTQRFLHGVRPETIAIGVPRDDSTYQFFRHVNELLTPEMTVIDVGCGRGAMFSSEVPANLRNLLKIQGKVKRVIGLDPDPCVAEHPYLDERHVINPLGAWPLPGSSADMIVCDWVLEHIREPAQFASEAERVLRPGGWLCARTPNRYGYVGLGARLIPSLLQSFILRKLWSDRNEVDVFDKYYRLNTYQSLNSYFEQSKWEKCIYTFNGTPRYHGNKLFLFSAIELYQKLMPRFLGTDLIIILKRV